MPDILLHLLPVVLASLLYAGLGWHFWITRWGNRNHPARSLGMSAGELLLLAIATATHGLGLYQAVFSRGEMHLSFSITLSLMLWVAVVLYSIESLFARMEGLQALVLPLASLCTILPEVFPQTRTLTNTTSWVFGIHFLTAMLAYSLFTLTALHAVFMAAAERALHNKHHSRRLEHLPPLLAMESLLFRMIAMAFILLTVALISGILFAEALYEKPFSFDHKTLLAFLSWLFFAALLGGRYRYGWRGRIALRWTLTGFLILLVAYIGSRFVLEAVL